MEKQLKKVEGKIKKVKKQQEKRKKWFQDRDKDLQEVSLALDEGLCGYGLQCGSFGTASLFCTQSLVNLRLASFPGHTPTKKSSLVSTICVCM